MGKKKTVKQTKAETIERIFVAYANDKEPGALHRALEAAWDAGHRRITVNVMDTLPSSPLPSFERLESPLDDAFLKR